MNLKTMSELNRQSRSQTKSNNTPKNKSLKEINSEGKRSAEEELERVTDEERVFHNLTEAWADIVNHFRDGDLHVDLDLVWRGSINDKDVTIKVFEEMGGSKFLESYYFLVTIDGEEEEKDTLDEVQEYLKENL